MNARLTVIGLVILVALGLATAPAGADTIAYNVPAGTAGTQAFAGPLGMDFNVNQPIFITRIGVFDDNSDGLNRDLTAYVWDRNNTAAPIETISFTTAAPGTLVGGSRFKPLAAPLYLPAGFQGAIVGENYGAGERNGNIADGLPRPWTTNDGGGLVSFVGRGRWSTTQGAYPAGLDGGPVNRYAAGTFAFAEVRDIEPGIGTPLYVANPSFELPGRSAYPTGGYYGTDTVAWTPTGAGSAGDYNGPSLFSDPVPDGDHVAFANAGSSLTSDPIQGETLEADTLYIMEAQWGRRTSYVDPIQPTMALRAGGVELGVVDNTDVGNGPDVAAGKFETARGYFTANHNATIGSELDIVLANPAGSPTQPAWDDVRLVKITDAAIDIDNHSFESPIVASGSYDPDITGWDDGVAGDTNAGVFKVASEIIPADGSQTAYIKGGISISQTLDGVPLMANHRYFLLVEVGDRDNTVCEGYQVELLAGGQQIAMDDNSLSVKEFTNGAEFLTTSVIELHVSGGHPLIGQDLGIQLTALGVNANQTLFDNVRLFAVPIPEPQTFVLLALGLLGMAGGRWRKRRQ